MSFKSYVSTNNTNRDADSFAIIGNVYNSQLSATLKNLIVLDTISLSNATFTGSIEVDGLATFNDGINVLGTINQTGNHTIFGNINQSNGNYTLNGSINQSNGNYSLIGSMNQTGGNHNLYGSINQTGGNYNLTGSINQTGGNYSLNGSMNQTGGNYSLNGSMNQTGGNYSLNGSMNQTGGNYSLNGSMNQTGGNYSLNGNLNQTGTIVLKGHIDMKLTDTNNSIVIKDGNINQTDGSSQNVIIGNESYTTPHILTNVISIGFGNRQSSTQDDNSIFIGRFVAKLGTESIANAILIGSRICESLVTPDLDKSIMIGNDILATAVVTSLTKNLFVGTEILNQASIDALNENVIIGSDTLNLLSTNINDISSNVCIGTNNFADVTRLGTSSQSLLSNTIVGNNVFDGMNMDSANTNDVSWNSLFGHLIGSSNSAAGYREFSLNTIVGEASLYSNSNLTGANRNTLVGQGCMYNTSANRITNTVGFGSLSCAEMTNVTTIDNCTFIGTRAKASNSVAGPITNRIAIGSNALVSSDNSCVIGVTGTSSPNVLQTKVGIGITAPNAALHVKHGNNASDPSHTFIVESKTNTSVISVNNSGQFALHSVAGQPLNLTTDISSTSTYNFPYVDNLNSNIFVSSRYFYSSVALNLTTPVPVNISSPLINASIGIISFTLTSSSTAISDVISVTQNNFLTTSKHVILQLQIDSSPPGLLPLTFAVESVTNGAFQFRVSQNTSQSFTNYPIKVIYMVI